MPAKQGKLVLLAHTGDTVCHRPVCFFWEFFLLVYSPCYNCAVLCSWGWTAFDNERHLTQGTAKLGLSTFALELRFRSWGGRCDSCRWARPGGRDFSFLLA